MMSGRTRRIFFDQTQNERGRLDSTYAQLADLLKENGFRPETYKEYMILPRKLKEADAIVFGCPNSSKLRPSEIDTIKKYVKNGGGLMLLALSGGDRGLMNNMSQISKDFGIAFENTAVKDTRNNAGVPTMPIIRDLASHPITEGVSELLIPASCTLRTSGDVTVIAKTSDVADPAGQPIVAIAEYGRGRIICVGSYEIFRSGGMKNEGNKQFAMNAFRWLCGAEATVRPSEVAKTPGKTITSPAPSTFDQTFVKDMENTIKRLIDMVFDLQKDMETLSKSVAHIDENIESLRDQFQTFAEKTQEQLGLVIPTRQFKSPEENKIDSIKSDIRSLNKELDSVKQLRDHIEQKHSSGAMPRETYEEQTAKLDERIKSLEKHIKKKQKELDKLQAATTE
ncbi:MAG: hypothetical protein K9W43_01885 [Candidatus Thorarchaeota archaeon]|nr:hypothetical protein [Candidatus Thorarchaeota archaeon]